MEELIVKEVEIKEKLTKVINNSGLPAFILKPIIKEFYEQLVVLEQQQYAEAKKIKEQKENQEAIEKLVNEDEKTETKGE